MEEILKCKLCENYFNAPIALSCGHTFCRKCIIDNISDQNSFICTICNKNHNITEEKVMNMRVNDGMKKLAKQMKNSCQRKSTAEDTEVRRELLFFFVPSISLSSFVNHSGR